MEPRDILSVEMNRNNDVLIPAVPPPPPPLTALSEPDNYSRHSDYYPIQPTPRKYLQIISPFFSRQNQYFTGLSMGDSFI